MSRGLALALLASCAATPEDAARFLAPDTVYVERGDGSLPGSRGDVYDDETWTVGLQWNLMPREVRVVSEEAAPRAWYEPQHAATVTEGGSLVLPASVASALLAALGGAVAYRKKKNGTETE